MLLPLLQSDLLEIVERSLDGTLAGLRVDWRGGAAATVVLASGGYPGAYETGKIITGLEAAAHTEGVTIFHAGTALDPAGQVVTAGRRVLTVTGVADDLPQALKRAYAAIDHIYFDEMQYRTDIGWQALIL